jgi:probable rRNA maturation factor
VLTFPYSEPKSQSLEGEIVIGYQVAVEYAADRGHETNLELHLYVVHGCLHLCGYDDLSERDAREMRKKEREYLTLLGLPNISGD